MLVFAQVKWLHVLGRVLLSLDIFFFFMRIFQMLMVFEELGLMLVMVYKMVKDTRNFMIILLIFVLAYSVASESLLYPEGPMTWQRLFHLPRKGYWHVFGEFLLDEIELRENSSCNMMTDSKYYGYDSPPCPTVSGSYIVPFLLGIHVMITNVLLLNLLIARFGVTFNKVHDEALQYQSWHRCQIITEYYSRESVPPPFNILYTCICNCGYYTWKLLCLILSCCISCFTRCCRRKRNQQGGIQRTESTPLVVKSGETPRLSDVKARRSADGRSICVKWKMDVSASKAQGNSPTEWVVLVSRELEAEQAQDQPGPTPAHTPMTEDITYKVKVSDKAKQAMCVWDLDSNSEYTVSVQGISAALMDIPSTWSKGDLNVMLHFENSQALYVRSHEDLERPLVKDLKEQTETLKQEIAKVSSHVKETSDAIKSLHKDFKPWEKLDETCKAAFTKIEKNFEDFTNYLQRLKNVSDERKKKVKELKQRVQEETQQKEKALAEALVAKEARQKAEQSSQHFRQLETILAQQHRDQQQLLEQQLQQQGLQLQQQLQQQGLQLQQQQLLEQQLQQQGLQLQQQLQQQGLQLQQQLQKQMQELHTQQVQKQMEELHTQEQKQMEILVQISKAVTDALRMGPPAEGADGSG